MLLFLRDGTLHAPQITGPMVTQCLSMYVNEILIPYVTEKRKELKLAMDYPALVLFDTFKGQCINEVYYLLTHT